MSMELFRLLGRIVVDNSEANRNIDETTDKAEQSGGKFSAVMGKIGGAAVTIGKTTAAAIGTAATGIGALTKAAVDNYADYEQLVGGVETLFKDSADKVMNYADNAYKTAGLSANNYMETVTSFSASLLQSLGGDTEAAAETANMAITDMADNANKMGSDISSIQAAYQGFAKQNYTMLDNLKLGYGGTATEMARLINDSGVLGDKLIDLTDSKNIGKALNEVGFAKMIEAIHAVQENMDITGTTAKEAASTIQGSVASMKSAWENFLTGMADPNQDFSALTDNLVESFITVVDNLIPRFIETIPRLVDGLVEIVKVLSDYLPDILKELLPALINGAIQLIGALGESIPELLSIVVPIIADTLQMIVNDVSESLGLESFNVIGFFNDISEKCTEMYNQIAPLLAQLFSVVGGQLLPLIMDIISTVLPIVIDLIGQLLPPIIQIVNEILPLLIQLIEPLLPLLEPILALLEPILQVVMAIIEPLIHILSEILPPFIQYLSTLIQEILPWLEAALRTVADIITQNVTNAFENIMPVIENVKGYFTALIDFIKNVFTGNWKGAWEAVKDIFGNIFEGIANLFKIPINNIIDGINSFLDGINGIEIPDWVPLVGGKSFNIPMIPKLNVGMDYVPYDNYPAYLHKGETVLTSSEAEEYRNEKESGYNKSPIYQFNDSLIKVEHLEINSDDDIDSFTDKVIISIQEKIERKDAESS